MKSESSQPSSDSGKAEDVDIPAGDSLPVFLDDEALQSMEGETVPGDVSGADDDEGARLAVSKSPAVSPGRRADSAGGSGDGSTAGGRGFSYFKALVVFLFAQIVVLIILGAVFRDPLSQVYDRLVERGFLQPNSLPWQTDGAGASADSPVGEVAWEDVRLRYQLTLLADAAIARADRGAFDELRGLLDIDGDPARRAAARSEVFRVQQMYASASKLATPALPVAEIYPGVSEESELSEEQIIKLLSDPDRETERRLRAAELLEGRRTLLSTDALVMAMQKDKDLDVVKQAMVSFKANTGYPGSDMFDAPAAEKWWSQNASRLAGEFEQAKSEKPAVRPEAVAPQPADKTVPLLPETKPQPQAVEPAPSLKPAPKAGAGSAPVERGPGADANDSPPQTRQIRPIDRKAID